MENSENDASNLLQNERTNCKESLKNSTMKVTIKLASDILSQSSIFAFSEEE